MNDNVDTPPMSDASYVIPVPKKWHWGMAQGCLAPVGLLAVFISFLALGINIDPGIALAFGVALLVMTFPLYAGLWHVFGKESVHIQDGFLAVHKTIFGIGRKKKFDWNSIRAVRACGYFGRLMDWKYELA